MRYRAASELEKLGRYLIAATRRIQINNIQYYFYNFKWPAPPPVGFNPLYATKYVSTLYMNFSTLRTLSSITPVPSEF